jgi:hypothetical protein
MPFTSEYLLAAAVVSCLAGFLGYRKGGRLPALLAVVFTFAILLVILVGFIVVLTDNM